MQAVVAEMDEEETVVVAGHRRHLGAEGLPVVVVAVAVETHEAILTNGEVTTDSNHQEQGRRGFSLEVGVEDVVGVEAAVVAVSTKAAAALLDIKMPLTMTIVL
jgi:hypothetical protein